MRQFKESLIFLDIYGKKPLLNILDNSSLKSLLGGILSLITYLFLVVLIIYFGLQIIFKQKQRITVSITNNLTPPPVYLSQNNFSFSLGLQNLNFDQYINESIYTVSIYISNMMRDPKNDSSIVWNVTELKSIRCSSDHFPQEYLEQISHLQIKNMYCLDKLDFPIYGVFDNPSMQSIRIYVRQCVNSTKNNNSCMPQTVIDKFTTNPWFTLTHTDYTFDPTNITSPNQVSIGDVYNIISYKTRLSVVHELKTVRVISDNGLVFEQLESKDYLQTNRVKYLLDPSPGSSLVYYEIRLSTQIDQYRREYMKVQDVAAQIGGMINFMTTLGIIVTYFYSEIKYNELLINHFFDFITNDITSGITSKAKSIFKYQKPTSNTKLNNFMGPDDRIKSSNNEGENPAIESKVNKSALELNNNTIIDSKEYNLAKIKKRRTTLSMELSFMESAKIYLCPCSQQVPKTTFYLEATRRINQKLDIMNLLKVMDEVEKLKFLVMDENQLVLFNTFPKRVINDYEFVVNKDTSAPSGIKSKAHYLQKHYNFVDQCRNLSGDPIAIENAYNIICERIARSQCNQYDRLLAEILSDEFNNC